MPESSSSQLPGDASLFHLLVDSIKDYAIFAIDASGHIASWNTGAERIKGYTAEEVIGKEYSIFFSEEDQAAGKPSRLLSAAAKYGRTDDEGWRVRKDGSQFRASIVLTAVYSPDGKLAGFSKVTRDVTEPRAAQDALRMRERQLLDTQDLAGLGSWDWDIETGRVHWTDKLYEVYGLNRHEIEPSFEEYINRVHPDDRDRVRLLIEEAYRKGGTFAFEERIVRPDGSIRVLRSRGRAVQNSTGKLIRLMGACLDITDVKQAEAQAVELATEQAARAAAEAYAAGLRFLTRSSELLASTLDYEETLRTVAALAVPEVADWCAVDLVEGENELRRVAVSHADASKMGLADRLAQEYPATRDGANGAWRVIDTGEPELYADIPDDLLTSPAQGEAQLAPNRGLGLRSAITVPLAGRSGVLGALSAVQAESGRRFNEQDLRILQELGRLAGLAIDNARLHREVEGQNSLLAYQASELEQQTEELQAQATHLEDIMSELEVSNEELSKRSVEAEEANRAKSDFLATMSHELRTPLNAIFGYADLLDMGLHGPITPPQHGALERIKRNQRALLVLINDVLNFAKLEAGKLQITITDIPVGEVIDDVAAVVGPQFEAKGLSYECECADASVRLLGERERVEQVLLNLLTNAAKFTDPGGSIRVVVTADELHVRLSVCDTGRGIPPDRLQAIFDPFVQIDRKQEDTGERGVGLGLAISRDLAEAMGGTLAVKSEVGRGSTFTLALRRADRPHG